MDRRRALAILFVGGIVAATAALATSALAAGKPSTGATSARPTAQVAGATAGTGGKVSAVHGSTYTVDGPNGASVTIDTTSSTTYLADGSPTNASAVKVGDFVKAAGTVSNDGKTFTATLVAVGPPPPQQGKVAPKS